MAPNSESLKKDLGDSLILRRSTPADAQRLGEFNAKIHGEDSRDAEAVAAWTRDLVLKPHPTFHSDDFVLVEDVATGEIVSSLNLIDQTWTYEGIPFGVGRPELVGTDPAYRNRGLVREMFNVIHQLSAARGHLAQAITGIPYFYRQFGYEMGLDLGGNRWGGEPNIPPLKEGEQEPYRVRLAEQQDIPWLVKMYARECSSSMVNAVFDEPLWSYEIQGKSPENVNWWRPCVIETAAGGPVGYLARPEMVWGKSMSVVRYALAEGVSYRAVTPSVIRYIWNVGLQFAAQCERKLETFQFSLGADHPVYQSNAENLPGKNPPYAFYMRVPDLPAFLRQIIPVLEQRLAHSILAGHHGELKLSFYRGGVKLVFEKGHLTAVEEWKPKIKEDEGMAAFPNLTFLQLVFGYRTLEEIRHAYADCWANAEAAVLLGVLFPKKPSHIWAIS